MQSYGKKNRDIAQNIFYRFECLWHLVFGQLHFDLVWLVGDLQL